MADEALNPDVVDCPPPGAKNYSTLVRGGQGVRYNSIVQCIVIMKFNCFYPKMFRRIGGVIPPYPPLSHFYRSPRHHSYVHMCFR